MTIKGNCFDPIQDIEAAMTAKLGSFNKRTSRTTSESGKSGRICASEDSGCTLVGINGNKSFTGINF